MTAPTRLFGVEGAEDLYSDLDSAFDAQVFEWAKPGDILGIQEWSVIDPIDHLPSAEALIEYILESLADGEVNEGGYEDFDRAATKEVTKAFKKALERWVQGVTYLMANQVLAVHLIQVVDGPDGLRYIELPKEKVEESMNDMTPMEKWGKDHWSTLLYVETRNVDYDAWLDKRHLRTDGVTYPTRLRNKERIDGHSDIDVLKDLAAAGLMEGGRATKRSNDGAIVGLTYQYHLTDAGWELAHRLRRHRASGIPVAQFKPEEALV